MPLILHIFRKDARRLWKEIAGTLALLAWLTQLDSWRGGYTPGMTEGWLNLLLPLAWGCLGALSVLQDPVPGERQFWLTLPCPRGRWIAAKALFVAAFIHLPYLISNIVVLSARGFAPWQFPARLLQQQLLVLFAVTLPCIALAALVRKAMQFIVAAVAILGLAVVFIGSAEPGTLSFQPVPFVPVDHVRQWLSLALLGLFAAIVSGIQYGSRRNRIAQLTGATGLLIVTVVCLWFPPESSAFIEQALLPAKVQARPVAVRLDSARGLLEYTPFARNGVTVAIPLSLPGALLPNEWRFQQVWLELTQPDGSRLRAARFVRQSKNEPLLANLWNPDWEVLTFERSLFNRLANLPITVQGLLTVQHLVASAPVPLPTDSPVEVPGLGRCFRSGTDGSLIQEKGLRVVCESPAGVGDDMVRLSDSSSTRKWDHRLGAAMAYTTGPTSTWLSPVDRKETFFQLGSMNTNNPGMQWIAPLDIAEHSRMEVIHRSLAGQSLSRFELRSVRLGQYMVKPAPQKP